MECLICRGNDNLLFFQVENAPFCPTTPISKDNFTNEVTGRLEIVQCNDCGFIYNSAFDPAVVNKMYFEDFAASLPTSENSKQRLGYIQDQAIGLDRIRGKKIIEIGSSNFMLSKLMLDGGASKLLAFEPSNLFQPEDSRIQHIQEYFSKDRVPSEYQDADLVVMRHVMEHIVDPMEIARQVRSVLADSGFFYVEVPNAETILSERRFYDFFYEHVSYFTPNLLQAVLQSVGFDIVKKTDLVEGQHFGLLCQNNKTPESIDFYKMRQQKPSASDLLDEISQWRDYLATISKEYETVGIYGAGAHAVGASILLELTPEKIISLFDLNPYKQGKYSPVLHIPILSPENEKLHRCAAIVVIAPLHEPEIIRDLRKRFRFQGAIYGTYPELKRAD